MVVTQICTRGNDAELSAHVTPCAVLGFDIVLQVCTMQPLGETGEEYLEPFYATFVISCVFIFQN